MEDVCGHTASKAVNHIDTQVARQRQSLEPTASIYVDRYNTIALAMYMKLASSMGKNRLFESTRDTLEPIATPTYCHGGKNCSERTSRGAGEMDGHEIELTEKSKWNPGIIDRKFYHPKERKTKLCL